MKIEHVARTFIKYVGFRTIVLQDNLRNWGGLSIGQSVAFFTLRIYNVYTKEVLLMQAQVKTWGNSQGIRIPKEVLQEAEISVDDILDVKVSNGMIMLVKPFRHKTLEERAAEYGGQLHLDGEFDWGEPIGREIW